MFLINQLIEEIDPSTTEDSSILAILKEAQLQGMGTQNRVLIQLAKKLEFYGKNDLKIMLKNTPLSRQPLEKEEETKPYLIIAKDIFEKFRILTLKESDQIMVFNHSCYTFDTSKLDLYISGRIEEMNLPCKYNFSEIEHFIKKNTYFSMQDLNYERYSINFENGVYNLVLDKFYPHEEEDAGAWHYFYKIPHRYLDDKKYDCPKFKKAVIKWIDKKTKNGYRERNRFILLNDIFEAIGLCMTTNTSYKTSFLNYGPKNSGKTQFFNILNEVIGKMNIATQSLQRITKNEFGTVRLQFKLLNYCPDLGAKKIWDTSIFKNLTGGDALIAAEIKGGKGFDYIPTAKFWFNCNKIPSVHDINDDAFFFRFVIIPFLNVFDQDDNDFEVDFFKEITGDKNEIQGIIHEGIKGLKRLQERKGFRKILKEKTKHFWNYESDDIYAYIYDFCEINKNNMVEVDEIYHHYTQNCRGVPMSKNIITKEMQKMGIIKKKATSKNEDGKRPECYYGIDLKDLYKIKDIEDEEIDVDRMFTPYKNLEDYNNNLNEDLTDKEKVFKILDEINDKNG